MCPKAVTPTIEETLALLAGRVRHLEAMEYPWALPRGESRTSNAHLDLTVANQVIPNCTVTFTPPLPCRAFVMGDAPAQLITALTIGVVDYIMEIQIDGVVRRDGVTTFAGHARWDARDLVIAVQYDLDVSAHTIRLRARVSNAADTYRIASTRAGMNIILLPQRDLD